MPYQLTVLGEPEPRARLDVSADGALRIAQGLANTEGVDVEVIGPRLAVKISGDETQYPALTLAERCAVVTTDVLREMLDDATEDLASVTRERQTILDELARRDS